MKKINLQEVGDFLVRRNNDNTYTLRLIRQSDKNIGDGLVTEPYPVVIGTSGNPTTVGDLKLIGCESELDNIYKVIKCLRGENVYGTKDNTVYEKNKWPQKLIRSLVIINTSTAAEAAPAAEADSTTAPDTGERQKDVKNFSETKTRLREKF